MPDDWQKHLTVDERRELFQAEQAIKTGEAAQRLRAALINAARLRAERAETHGDVPRDGRG